MPALLPTPTLELVREYGKRFDTDPITAATESTLSFLLDRFPKNDDPREVLTKVAAINSLYSTRIFAVVALADQITRLNSERRLDDLIDAGDPSAVDLIACQRLGSESKLIHFYSFASKYCSWHNQRAFPIYDMRARENVWRYQRQRPFREFSGGEIWCYKGYEKYREIITAFRSYYALEELTFKELDKFLYWFNPNATSDKDALDPVVAGQ
jgi:hypothetical protein